MPEFRDRATESSAPHGAEVDRSSVRRLEAEDLRERADIEEVRQI